LLCLMGLPSSLGYLSLCHTLHSGRNYVVLDSSGPFPDNQYGRHFGVVSSTPATLAEYWAMGKAGQELPFSVTNMIVSGGSIANAFCDQIVELFNVSLYSLFGSTETGLVAFAPTSALDLDAGEVGLIRNSCGLTQDEKEPKSVRFETGFVAPYVDDALLSTGSVTPLQSWASNDRCEILDTGILKFSGRASETVNSGGVKMALSKIEDAANAYPKIHQACVLLQPDALGIERVILVLKSDQDLDRSAFAKHYRSLFPEPLFPIRFFEMDELPKTASGKIDRFKLKRFILKNL
ncbi:MAG: class I adenylate-forming enzyme family protein, partial [Hyphomicrobiales bacterium]